MTFKPESPKDWKDVETAVVSGRLGEGGWAAGLAEQTLCLLSSAAAEKALYGLRVSNYPEALQEGALAFINLLAQHPSAKLRCAAAETDALSAEAIRALARDPSRSVRIALLANDAALEKLAAEDCIALAGSDADLVARLVNKLELSVRRAFAARDAERAAARAAVLRKAAAGLSGAGKADIKAAAALDDALALLEEIDAGVFRPDPALVQQQAERASMGDAAARERRRSERIGAFGRPGEWGFALVFARRRSLGCNDAEPVGPMLPLSIKRFESVFAAVSSPDVWMPDEFVVRLAESRSADVRELISDRDRLLSDEALEALMRCGDYEVRLNLLAHREANGLADEDAPALLQGDPDLFLDAFEYGKASEGLLDELQAMYGCSSDPDVKACLSALSLRSMADENGGLDDDKDGAADVEDEDDEAHDRAFWRSLVFGEEKAEETPVLDDAKASEIESAAWQQFVEAFDSKPAGKKK